MARLNNIPYNVDLQVYRTVRSDTGSDFPVYADQITQQLLHT